VVGACGVTCVGGGHVGGVAWGRVDFKALFFCAGRAGFDGVWGCC
jgi:hypothetical protein